MIRCFTYISLRLFSGGGGGGGGSLAMVIYVPDWYRVALDIVHFSAAAAVEAAATTTSLY